MNMNTNVHLIGLNGKARSGKDTTAGIISEWCKENDLTFAQDAFARRLKESAAASLGIVGEEVAAKDAIEFCELLKKPDHIIHIVNDEGTGYTITGREFLQFYGTEAHRDVFGSNFWVDVVLPPAVEMDGYNRWWDSFLDIDGEPANVAVITDVRFPNEAERIQELGGDIWKVERDGSGAGDHASEQELDGELIDVVIDNNGSLDELAESVDVLMEIVTVDDKTVKING